MRRNMMLVVGLAATVSGCGIFSAHSNVIETAAGQELTAEHLADILTRIQAPTMVYDTRIGTFVTGLWTDVTLFSQAVAADKVTGDSAFVADAMWPIIQETLFTRWIDTVVARKAHITDATIDSAYKADNGRAIQHVLVKADSAAPKEVKDIARRKIDGYLAQLKGGANFSKLAHDNTEDPGSRTDSGYYGPKAKGTYVPPFEKVLWSLKPGEMSGVVTTNYGYHVLRRPTEAESARLWRDSLGRASAPKVMADYEAEVGRAGEIKVDANAVPRIRAAVENRAGHNGDKTVLATFKGGAFTVGDFIRWINAAMADPSRAAEQEQGFKQASADTLKTMVTKMAQQTLILEEAKKNNVRLTADEWKLMLTNFGAAVDSLKAQIGLTGPRFDVKTTSASDRSKAAAAKVDEYFNDITSQKKQPRMLPGILAATLRERAKTKFNAVGLQHGLDLAKAKHSADSAKIAGAAGAPLGGAPVPDAPIKPAPGGPPVGNPPPAPKKP